MKKLLPLVVAFLVFSSFDAFSQVIKPSGNSDRPVSQLVLWFDNDQITSDRSTTIQITNTNSTEGVWVFIQFYRSLDLDENIETTGDKVICEERDFVDFYTPRDTHVYDLSNILRNLDGFSTGLNMDNSKGYVLVTPIVNDTDLQAISFNHLIGESKVLDIGEFDLQAFNLNAMGRDAVDFSSGEILPDATVLDGVNNGYVVVQPDELKFNFNNIPGDKVDVVGINFIDDYNTNPALGYRALPGQTDWRPFVQDHEEFILSCTPFFNTCFLSIGLLDTAPTLESANLLLGDNVLCSGISLPVTGGTITGWSDIIISDYDDLENQFGVFAFTTPIAVISDRILSFGGVDWMLAGGEEQIPAIESPCDAEDPDAIIGTDGADVLDGTGGADIIIGLGGNDVIRGFGGADCIDGGLGADTIEGGNGADDIFGGRGADIIDGNRGADIIEGNGGSDILNGNRGSDTIRGNGGSDQLNGGNGTDILDGGGGTDSCINGETVINCES